MVFTDAVVVALALWSFLMDLYKSKRICFLGRQVVTKNIEHV